MTTFLNRLLRLRRDAWEMVASVLIALGVVMLLVATLANAGAQIHPTAVRWNVASSIVVAWVVTIPAAGLIGAAFYELAVLLG